MTHASKKLHSGRGTVGKTAVVGIRDQCGQVRATPTIGTTGSVLVAFIAANVPEGATVVTDLHKGYDGLAARGFTHKRVNHSVGEYVRDMAHTNGIESFWALLKRGHYGIYHYMSKKHLHRYVNEFSFRHNTSRNSTMSFIGETIDRMQGNRLTYRELISNG